MTAFKQYQLIVVELINIIFIFNVHAVVSVTDPPYNAIPNDGLDDTSAFQNAFNGNAVVHVPAGTYEIQSTLTLTNRLTVIGIGGKTQNDSAKPTIHYTGTGSCFDITDNTFEPVHIENLRFTGGPGSINAYCIKTSRPLSVYKRLFFHNYEGNCLFLTENTVNPNVSCWSTSVEHCRAIMPVDENYIGLNIDVNGGNITIDHWKSTFGNIGINLQRGEDVLILSPNVNLTNDFHSTGVHLTGIRLAGIKEKKSVKIIGGYVEGCTNGVYIQKGTTVTIQNLFIDDLGYGGPGIFIEDNDVENVSVTDCTIRSRTSGGSTIDIGSAATQSNIYLRNNLLWGSGTTPKPLANPSKNSYTNIVGSKHLGYFRSQFRYFGEQYDVGSGLTKNLVSDDLNKIHLLRSGSALATFNLPVGAVGEWVMFAKNTNSTGCTLRIDPSGNERIHGLSQSNGAYIESPASEYDTIFLIADESGWVPAASTPNWVSQ